MNYIDASALVKRFVAEKGSDSVAGLFAAGEPAATSKIAYAEVYSALARRRREGGLSERDFGLACRSFEEDWKSSIRVDLRDDVLQLARDLIKRRAIRGFDAIHLASALTVARELGEAVRFVAADARLLEAAKAEKLQVLNPEG